MRRVAGGLVAVLMVIGGCGLFLPPGGISRAEAEAFAIQQAPGTVDRVLSAEGLPLGEVIGPNVEPGVPRDRLVWVFVLEGDFPVPCRPRAPQCPQPGLSALVGIDYETGEFVMSSIPADAR